MIIYEYRKDNYNSNKFYLVKKSNCCHYYIKEFLYSYKPDMQMNNKCVKVRKHIFDNIYNNSTFVYKP